jgi:tRNA (guanine37-N1)-methyltransferase
MKIRVFSLFPQIIEGYFSASITAKAINRGLLSYENINIRDYGVGRHRVCDDMPYGGGAGMVIKPEPVIDALKANIGQNTRVIFPSPSGKLFDQSMARRLANMDDIAFIAGRYEGIDQRIIDNYVHEEISIGDYVMASGELSCLVIIDTIMRLVEGVLSPESLTEESFENNLLEYPQYTRPEIFENMHVPDILLSGHHAKIKQWRMQKSLEKTLANRPEIVQNAVIKKQ